MAHRSFWMLAIVVILCVATLTLASAQSTLRITGTYSNMYFNKEGGDVVGEEIKIVATGKGYQGVLQFAEGAPGDLVVVDIKLVGVKISFAIPDTNPYAGQFTGTIEGGVLKGEFRFKSGASERVELRRGKSYWD